MSTLLLEQIQRQLRMIIVFLSRKLKFWVLLQSHNQLLVWLPELQPPFIFPKGWLCIQLEILLVSWYSDSFNFTHKQLKEFFVFFQPGYFYRAVILAVVAHLLLVVQALQLSTVGR